MFSLFALVGLTLRIRKRKT
ncbi:hypothetical protein [Vibrio thalassae]